MTLQKLTHCLQIKENGTYWVGTLDKAVPYQQANQHYIKDPKSEYHFLVPKAEPQPGTETSNTHIYLLIYLLHGAGHYIKS
jgi:hypothetical protein